MDQESCANGASQGHSLIQVKRIGKVPPAKLELASLSIGGIGSTADLTETGYNAVRAQCCTAEMAQFIRRFVEEKLTMRVCNVGGPVGMAHWYDCEDDAKTFADLEANTDKDSRAVKGACAWIGDVNGCPTRDADCPEGTGTLAPCGPPVSCLDIDTDYQGDAANGVDIRITTAEDTLDCQAECQGEPRCTHFTFRVAAKSCYLKDYQAVLAAGGNIPTNPTGGNTGIQDTNSGPRKCPLS